MPFILPPINQDVLRAGSPQLEDLEGDDVWTVSLSNLDDLFADSAPLGSKVGVITFSARIIQSVEEKLTPKTFGSVFSI